MDWALKTTVNHIELRDSFVTANGQWLDILLHDGRAFRFRPGALINTEAPIEVRTKLLNRLISIGIRNAQPAEMNDSPKPDLQSLEDPLSPDAEIRHDKHDKTVSSQNRGEINPIQAEALSADAHPDTDFSRNHGSSSFPDNPHDPDSADSNSVDPLAQESFSADLQLDLPASDSASDSLKTDSLLPVIRNAAYFLRSHTADDSMVYLPLTDFIAVGVVQLHLQNVRPVFYSQIATEYLDTAEVLSDAILELRGFADSLSHGLNLEVRKIAGAKVFSFIDPLNYESSWFFDLEMMHRIATNISHNHFDSLPLFIPVSRSELYIVFDNDPHLADFFQTLQGEQNLSDPIYPLPHTLSADGWREWIPFPDSRLAEILGSLRGKFRQEIYREQVRQMLQWGNFGALKDYERETLAGGEQVSNTVWRDVDRFGSVPDTDFITFVREPSPHPWESARALKLSIRSHIAREIWAEGFSRAENAWPPRWIINGFPSETVLEKLRDAGTREF